MSGNGATLGGMTTNELGVLDIHDLPIIVISRECKVAQINRAATTVLGLQEPRILVVFLAALSRACRISIESAAE